MSEQVIRVPLSGEASSLSGILTDSGKQNTTAVVFWNSGLLHHVGPNRLFVQIARALSKEGMSSFRFDVSGLGDSERRAGSAGEGKRAVGEVRQVLDFLQSKKGFSRFALVGLCSGSDEAHRVSVEDPRVVAVVHLDGYSTRTTGFWLRFAAARLLKVGKWLRLFSILFSRIFKRGEGSVVVFERDYPTHEEIRGHLRRLVDRGASLLYVYTGGLDNFAYGGQFAEMFKGLELRGQVESEYRPEADHLYSDPEERSRLIGRVVEWIRRRAFLS